MNTSFLLHKKLPLEKTKTEIEKERIFMRQFTYILKHETGIHARPAGMVVQEAKKYDCKIIVSVGGKTADAKGLFSVMGLSAKGGDGVEVICEGTDENNACAALYALFSEQL